MNMSRRDFMKASLSAMAYFGAASSVPAWVAKSAHALSKNLPSDRILVIVQMAGGNDGLNTVIPYADPMYLGNTWRPNLHITSGLEPTTLDSLNALHPKMVRLKEWWDNGNMAVVQNVGYPNPNLSHFVATDFWEFGTSPGSNLGQTAAGQTGWAARFFDNACGGVPPDQIDPLTMVAGGHFLVPTTLDGSATYRPPAIADFEFYQLLYPGIDAQPGSFLAEYGDIVRGASETIANFPALNGELDFLQRSFNLAQASVDDVAVAAALDPVTGAEPYPRGTLGDGLDICSRIIRAGFNTKIFYVTQSGYDTHANQFANGDPANAGDHQQLLEEFDQSLHAFMTDMALTGNLDKVVLLTFSEFGRRVAENGSDGTDHGTGNCLFALGGPVEKGVYGGQPKLDEDTVNANSGNLEHDIDFRAVYSRVIRDWFGADPEPIFGTEDWEQFGIGDDMDAIPFLKGDDPPPPEIPEDVNDDGEVNAVDVQLTINDALGGDSGQNTDVNNDGVTNAVDIQSVINAALGISGKATGPFMPGNAASRKMGR